MLNPEHEINIPSPNLIARFEPVYTQMEALFFRERQSMPKSLIRKRDRVYHQDRHNIMQFNYLFRKMCEGVDGGIMTYHAELPLVKSPAKLHALDDVMQQICK